MRLGSIGGDTRTYILIMLSEHNIKEFDNTVSEALRSGDLKAFERLFFLYYKKICNFIAAIIKSESDAEEIAQDIFVRIWTHREKFDPRQSLDGYMYTIARNATLNFLRKRRPQGVEAENTKLESYFRPEDKIFSDEMRLLVDTLLANMNPRRRDIFIMSQREGLSNEEIASVLKISKKSVENQLCIAKKEVRRVIEMYLTSVG